MNEYLIRKAKASDIPFLADVIIAAEKGMSDRLSFSTLFNLPENKVRELIISMLEEEVDGTELSLSSFIVTEYQGAPISGSGAWIEGLGGSMPSKILKSNLISYTFGKDNIEFLQSKVHIIKDVLVDREPLTLQLEYFHISNEHLGKGLDSELMKKIEENALAEYPELEKVQCQLFKNSIFAIKILLKHGFTIVKKYKADNEDIFDYLPSNEKYLMEKILKK
jgi:ribosomal protein S18 acetylase RimI-like enzyme